MIILMAREPINKQAAAAINEEYQSYGNLNLSNMAGDTLYIVDLRADGNFQKLSHPKQMAKKLIHANLPTYVKNIHLIVSDIVPGKSLLTYAIDLAKALKFHIPEIEVKVPAHIAHGATLICLPAAPENQWKVLDLSYGLVNEILESGNPFNYETFNQFSDENKQCVWAGSDIARCRDELKGVTPAYKPF
jgi:hypothetical protein